MVSGKQLRLSRITRRGRMLCVPMDHSLTSGPIKGLEEPEETIRLVARGGATSFLAHKGVIRSLSSPPGIGAILHISAGTSLGPSQTRKVLVSSVEEAVRLGADAVSVHVNMGSQEEPEMLEQLGSVADKCDSMQFPLIAMMYPRGENVKDPSDTDVVAHVARVGADAGADIVKTVYTGSAESFRKVVRGCQVPVVLAGGARVGSDLELLQMAKGAMDAGAAGVTFGRNVFQHEKVVAIVRALKRVVVDGRTVQEGMKELAKG